MADNLEELNRQLEAAQQKVTEAENNYSETREQLSKMGDEYYKATLLTVKEQEHVIEEYKRLRETLKKENERRSVLNKALDEETRVEKQKIEKAKQEVTEIQKKIEEAKKPKGLNAFLDRIGFRDPTKDDLATQYRAARMSSGIESIMSGNFASGARSILGTIPKIANFMGGPYFLAIQAVTSGLLKLDAAIAKTHQEVLAGTGGVYSPFRNKQFDSIIFQKQLKSDLKQYGLQDKVSEVLGSAFSSTGLAAITDANGNIVPSLLRHRVKSQGAALRYMGSLGISEDAVNNMFKISRNLEGQSESQSLATQYRLAERFKRSRYMTESEGAQQSLALYDQTKSLGVNFEWASRTVAKFDKALQLGEVSLNDFASVTRGLKGADTGKATGIAAMIRDVAIRNGITLPKEFMESSDLGAGLYLQTREGISNPNIQKALKLAGLQMQGGMQLGSSEYDKARGLQMILQGLYGSSISPDMALRIQKTGDWNPILGGKSTSGIVNNRLLPEQSEEILKDAKDFYKNQ